MTTFLRCMIFTACALVVTALWAAKASAQDKDEKPSPQAPAETPPLKSPRERAMGPDVKLANPFRYQSPPLPLVSQPRVSPNTGDGPTLVIIHEELYESGETEKTSAGD